MAPVIYCTKDFLAALQRSIYESSVLLEEGEVGSLSTCLNLLNLLIKGAIVHMDVNTEEATLEFQKKEANPYFKALIRNNKLSPNPTFFSRVKDLEENIFDDIPPLSSVLLTDFTIESCKRIEERYGYRCFSSQNIKDTSCLFNYSIVPIYKNRTADWSFASQLKHPHNAMVLIDPYLFEETDGEESLKQFLAQVMPSSLSREYQLCIIVSNSKNRNLALPKERLETFFKDNLRYPVKLTIVVASNHQIHDRSILTNFYWISSGHGFNLIRDTKGKRNTHLSIVPTTYINTTENRTQVLQSTVFSVVVAFKNEIARIVQNATNFQYQTNFIGEKYNRLLDN